MNDIENALFEALSPMDEPSDTLNRYILTQTKENTMGIQHKMKRKSFPAAAAIAAVLILSSSVTAFAAWRYLSAREAAEELSDDRLAAQFASGNELKEGETQIYGDYAVTLLGLVSGDEISSHLQKDDDDVVDGDKTYISVAISRTDGASMPDTEDAAFDPFLFYVSPYIKGLDPAVYNADRLRANTRIFVENGVEYRMLDTNNIEAFADCGIYIGVSEGAAYSEQAYLYDAASGEISRNETFDGVNALFELHLDPRKGDPEKAQEIIESMESYETGGEGVLVESAVDRWANGITPDNIEERAIPDEQTRKTVSFEEFMQIEGLTVPDDIGEQAFREMIAREYGFPEGGGMAERMTRYGTTWDDAWVETITLNPDYTVTYLRYVPKR